MSQDDWIIVRMRLQDARKFQADAAASGAAINRLGRTARDAGGGFDFFSSKGFLAHQMLYTLRRAAFAATVAIAGGAAAILKIGIGFNSMQEQGRIAFTVLLGSSKLARRELNTLFNIAAQTPFSFAGIQTAAQQFLAMGFNIQTTNKYLRVLGDVVSGLPQLGEGGVARLAVIFGQIRASGRLLGQDLLQLTQAGIPAIAILKKQLGLSQAQVQALLAGNLRIPSEFAIPALMRGLQERFRGLARAQSQSLAGLWSTAKDYAGRLFGLLTHPLFVRLESVLRTRILPLLGQLGKAFQRGGFTGVVAALDQATGAGGKLSAAWRVLSAAGTDFWRVLTKVVFPTLVQWFKIMRPVWVLVGVLAVGLDKLSHHTGLLRFVLNGILFPLRAMMFGLNLVEKAVAAVVGAFRGMGGALDFLVVAGASVVGFVTGLGPRIAGAAVGMFDGIKDAFRSAINWVIRGWNSLHFRLPSINTHIPGVGRIGGFDLGVPQIPTLATGGVFTRGGAAVVGERGAEVVNLPRGATVTPLGAGGLAGLAQEIAAAVARAVAGVVIEPADVNMNHQKVAQIVFKTRADARARA